MDDATLLELTNIKNALATHIASNNQKFGEYDALVSNFLTSKGNPIMADTTDNVKIHNHAPVADPTNAALLPAIMAATKSNDGGILGGAGGGLLGGLLLGSLLRNGGLLGGTDGAGVVTPTMLTAAINQAQTNTDNAVAASERLLTSRFDAEAQREIQASIERTAAATGLAISTGNAALGVASAKGFGEVNTQNALTSSALGVQIQKTAGDTQTQIATQTAALGVQTERTATANALAQAMGQKEILAAALENKYQLSQAIKADGDQTRALIASINDQNLNRQLTTAQNEIIELRNDGRGRDRARETEINVTQNVNQAQAQVQQQQQFQTINDRIAQLLASHQYLQQGIVNLGTMSGAAGQQTAANTRVN